jgi:hypothetical protein
MIDCFCNIDHPYNLRIHHGPQRLLFRRIIKSGVIHLEKYGAPQNVFRWSLPLTNLQFQAKNVPSLYEFLQITFSLLSPSCRKVFPHYYFMHQLHALSETNY